jgi:DNA topoisomerase IB
VYSHDVNDYLRDAAAAEVTAKDFRTWVATVSAAAALAAIDPPTSATKERTLANAVIAAVAQELGNTPAVCRASYIHPKVLADFGTGDLHEDWAALPRRRAGLTTEERHTLVVLGGRPRTRRRQAAAAAAA